MKHVEAPAEPHRSLIFLSVACSVVKALVLNFKRAETSQKAKKNRPFQPKKAVFVARLNTFDAAHSPGPCAAAENLHRANSLRPSILISHSHLKNSRTLRCGYFYGTSQHYRCRP